MCSVCTFGLSLLLKLSVSIVHKLHHGLHPLIANVIVSKGINVLCNYCTATIAYTCITQDIRITVTAPSIKDFFTVFLIPVVSDILRILNNTLKLLSDFRCDSFYLKDNILMLTR